MESLDDPLGAQEASTKPWSKELNTGQSDLQLRPCQSSLLTEKTQPFAAHSGAAS